MRKIIYILTLLFVYGSLFSQGSEMITNGSFTSASDWTADSEWTIADGKASYDDSGAGYLTQLDADMALSVEANKTYVVSFTIGSDSAAAFQIRSSSNQTYVGTDTYSPDDYRIEFTTPSDIGDGGFRIYGALGGAFNIDDISLTKNADVGDQPYYVAPDGNDQGSGSISDPWKTWDKVFDWDFSPGDTVYFRGGVYYDTIPGAIDLVRVSIDTSYKWVGNGTADSLIYFLNYPSENPILDCSRSPQVDWWSTAINMEYVQHMYFRGLTIRNVYQSDYEHPTRTEPAVAIGILHGYNLTFENITIHDVGGLGIQLASKSGWEAAIDTITYPWLSPSLGTFSDTLRFINCDVYSVCDTLDENDYSCGKADGFRISAHRPTYVLFEGCRMWYVGDDGMDLIGHMYVKIKDTWGFLNGDLEGDGSAFKLNGMEDDSIDWLVREMDHCISAFNLLGITENIAVSATTCPLTCNVYNHTSYGNEIGYVNQTHHDGTDKDNVYRNNISYTDDVGAQFGSAYIGSHNSWDIPLTLTDADFISLDSSQLWGPRQSDGSLPEITYLKPAEGSQLINAGTDVGLSFNGAAPDLGWYESNFARRTRKVGISGGNLMVGGSIILTYENDPDSEPEFPEPPAPATQIIADHTVVDLYDNIPQQWIDSVKTMWLSYVGESHSMAIRSGLSQLEDSSATYAVSILEAGTPEAYTTSNLRASRATWGDVDNATGWLYGYGPEDWYTSAAAISQTKVGLSYCNTNGPKLDVFALAHSYDVPELFSFDDYVEATKEYITYCTDNSIDTRVIFTTGALDLFSGEEAYNNHLRMELVRDSVDNDATRILFDYADIVSYSNAGVQETQTWDGNTFPDIHPDNGPGGVGHILPAGALRLGKAMWWTLARIAGWDGEAE